MKKKADPTLLEIEAKGGFSLSSGAVRVAVRRDGGFARIGIRTRCRLKSIDVQLERRKREMIIGMTYK